MTTERREVEGMTPVDRGLGGGCVLLPCALFLLAMTFGGILAHGPQPDGRIGQEPTRRILVFGLMASVGLTFYVATRFVTDCPVSKESGKVVLGGAVLMTALLGVAFNASAPAWIAWALPAAGLAGWLFETRSERMDNVRQRVVFAPPPAPVVREERLFFGRLATIAGTGLGTVGLWLAWPRDPAKTTAAPQVFVLLAVILIGCGASMLVRVWPTERVARYTGSWILLSGGVTSLLWGITRAPTLSEGSSDHLLVVAAVIVGITLSACGALGAFSRGEATK